MSRLEGGLPLPILIDIMYRSMIIGVLIALSAITSTVFGQGDVYNFGELMAMNTRPKLPELARIKSTVSDLAFNTVDRNKVGRIVMSNTSSKLQISSSTHKSTRTLFASVTSGSMPHGSSLSLHVSCSDNIKGQSGNSTEVSLEKDNKVVVNEIGTCYSGKKDNDGYGLEFILSVSEKAKIKTSSKVIVTFTMCEDV